MPRAEYNSTMAVYESAGPFTPGVLKGSTPCRVVFEDLIVSDDFPFSVINGYATYTPNLVSAGNWEAADNGVTLNLYFNDVLEFAEVPGLFYQAFYTEEVIPRSGALYRRVWFFSSL